MRFVRSYRKYDSMRLLLMSFFVWRVIAQCSSLPGYGSFRSHLEEKLSNPNGNPDAGADVYTGGSAVFLYLSCNEASTVATHEPVGGWTKVAIHELQHVHQVEMLRGHMTTITPPTDTLGVNRFQVRNYHTACPAVYETAIKGVLDALPASMKLLTVPTYALIVPETRGIGTAEQVTAAADEMEALMFPSDCAPSDGVVLNDNTWWHKESNQMAEGEAEWYAEGVLMAPGANAYNDANLNWDGAVAWAQRVSENMAMLNGSPGKQLYHLPLTFGSGNTDWSDTLSCLGWRNNPVGEVAYHFMKTVWRPATTHSEMQQHWITVFNSASYEAGFSTAFADTGTWQDFVCALETHYSIDRRTQTCAGIEVAPVRPATCVVSEDDGLSGTVIALIVVGAVAVASGASVAVYWAFVRTPMALKAGPQVTTFASVPPMYIS